MATFHVMDENLPQDKTKFERKGKKRDNTGRIALQPVIIKVKQETQNVTKCSTKTHIPILKVARTTKEISIKDQKEEIPMKQEKREIDTNIICTEEVVEIKNELNYVECGIPLEYAKDILSYYKTMEQTVQWPRANYMSKQMHLNNNMRCILVDWLASVGVEYELNAQTFHLSINYIDRFLSQMSVVKGKFQLLGAAAMMIAGKIEEIYPPDSKEWSYLTDNSYSSKQIQRMEQMILKVLKFDLQPPTILAFIELLCVKHKLDKETMYLAMYISELMLLEGEEYLHYLPSKLAASAIALARFTLSKRYPWPKKLEASSGYSLKQLSPVVQKQNRTFIDSPTNPHKSIQTKYKASKYHKVALLKPKVLNLDDSDDDDDDL